MISSFSFMNKILSLLSFSARIEPTNGLLRSQADTLEPVSYTHLDVYKRQTTLFKIYLKQTLEVQKNKYKEIRIPLNHNIPYTLNIAAD